MGGTMIRALQHATYLKSRADGDLGRSHGGLTANIHAAVDANAMPLQIVVTGGQQHAKLAARGLLESVPSGEMVLAEKACEADNVGSLSVQV